MHKDKIVSKKICTKGQLCTIVKKKEEKMYIKKHKKKQKEKKVTYQG